MKSSKKQALRSCPFCGRLIRLEREGQSRHYRLTCPAFKAPKPFPTIDRQEALKGFCE